ncbi:hypothetical protein GOP47_0016962 [Adiantum capillus-veneris]|uniref:Mitochondrial fission 1 protein n=1 Tax=Adiantum capillus-veneris TaxID=13818 RepID=A0A9D4ZC70_ADICA|nr:hypothetical protein GOP47_0016962 [Adiantum capillus-veneris]
MSSFLDTIGSFFGSSDLLPWTDDDIIQGCERDAVGAGSGFGKELDKNESYMRLSWALVHSRQVSDVQRGILMLEASLEKNPDEIQQREILYLLAVGNYRAGDIPRARRHIDHALEITPDFRQGLTLRKMIEDKIAKDGVIGIGIAAAAASVVAGGIAALLVKKR